MSLVIRPMTVADLAVADEIALAAYGGTRRRSELARYLDLQPGGWVLALRDGTPAGLGGATFYGPFAYIGLMAVHPTQQRQGIAGAIMDYLLAWLQAQECPMTLLDASAAGRPLYAKCGFTEDDKVVAYVREHGDAPAIPNAPVSVAANRDLPDLVTFDAPIFGARRDHVLASYLNDPDGRTFLTRDATGAVSGYLIAQEYNLGPWVAGSAEDAAALLAHALALPYPSGQQVLVPAANREAPYLLERYGFKAQRTLSHMRLGGTDSPRRRPLIYGQASFALG